MYKDLNTFSILVEEFVSVTFAELKLVAKLARYSFNVPLKWRKFAIFKH